MGFEDWKKKMLSDEDNKDDFSSWKSRLGLTKEDTGTPGIGDRNMSQILNDVGINSDADTSLSLSSLNRVTPEDKQLINKLNTKEDYYSKGLTADEGGTAPDNSTAISVRKTPEWKAINEEKAAQKAQWEQEDKPQYVKGLDLASQAFRETMFGDKREAEMQQRYGVNPTTGNPVADFMNRSAGTLAGYAMPIDAAGTSMLGASNKAGEYLLDKFAPKLGQGFTRAAAEGAITTLPLSVYDSYVQGMSPQEAAKNILSQTLFGAGLGTAGKAISYGVGKGVKAFTENISKPTEEVIDTITKSATPATPEIKTEAIKEIESLSKRKQELQQRISNLKESKLENAKQRIVEHETKIKEIDGKMRDALPDDLESLQKVVDNLKEKKFKGIQVDLQFFAEAEKKLEKLKQRSFPQTVANAEITSPELKQAISEKDFNHTPITNNDTLESARKLIDTNYDEAVRIAKSSEKATAESNAISQLLIKKAQDEGRWQDAIDILENTSKKATESGQAIQALSMWGRLTPEGMLKYAQRVIDNANKKTGNKIKMSEDFAKDITDSMKEINDMVDGRDKTVEIAKVLDKIAAQVPPGILQKISTLQTMAQLLNPKTAIRNIGGNAVFAATENISKLVGIPIDTLVSKVTKQRSILAPSLKTQAEGFKKGFGLGLEDAIKGIDTSGIKTQFEVPVQKVFRGKVLGGLEKAMNIELKATDRGFYQAAFEDSLREQMKISKTAAPTTEMIETAHLDGLYRTFQDKNKISDVFSGLKRSLNANKAFGLGDLILKYPKTPANILARGIDYSPIGITRSLYDLGKLIVKNDGSQRQVVQGLSRGITGSGLLFGGMMLAKLGILTGKTDSDKEAAAFKKEVGLGGYKLNTDALLRFLGSGMNPEAAKPQQGDTIMNYDWLQPTAIGLAAGANISQKQKVNALDVLGSIVTMIQGGTETLAEQPLLQGVMNLFNGYSTEDKITGFVKSVGASAPASFMPTFVSQVRQMTDNVSRQTKSDSVIEQAMNLVKNKMPGFSIAGKKFGSISLPENITTTGETKEMYQGGANNPLNVFLNPAFISKYKVTPGTKLLLDLYGQTGETKQFPRTAPKTVTINGKKIELTADQQNELQKTIGQNVMKRLNSLQSTGSPEGTLKRVINILDDEGERAKNKLIQQNKQQLLKQTKQ